MTSKGIAAVDPKTATTNVGGVFAAGDVVNGGKTVVEAVARGKSAAWSIDTYLVSKREGARSYGKT